MKKSIVLGLVISAMLIPKAILAQKKEKKTQSFTVSAIINAPADKVWKAVGEDYGAVAYSHPRIVSSEYINGSLKGGVGAERVCNFNEKGTKYLREKIAEYDPEKYTFTNRVYQVGKFPVDPELTFGTYTVEAIDESTSRITNTINYRTKPAFMGALAKGSFKKLVREYFIALEHHVNTGEKVTKDNFKQIKKQYKKNRKDNIVAAAK
ncbi:MAG: SRPBCC family protein [Bacteroidota bacterium]